MNPIPRILVVEPSRLVSMALSRVMEKFGLEVVLTTSGSEALAALGESAFELVITAFELGDMQADAFIRQAVATQAAGGRFKAVLFASTHDVPNLARLKAAGYQACFSSHELPALDDFLRRLLAQWQSRQQPLRVLVAEDSAVNQKVIVKLVEKLGHQASLVDNGRRALDAALAESFDVILMDIEMPVMNGMEATRRLREAGRQLPIFALTAHEDAAHRQACKEAGMNGVLNKPLAIKPLMAILATCRHHAE